MGGGREWRNERSATLTVSQWHSSSLPEKPIVSTAYFDPQIFSVLYHLNCANFEDVSWPPPPPANSSHMVVSLSHASTVVIKVKIHAKQLLVFIQYQPQAHLNLLAGRARWPTTSTKASGVSVLGDVESSATSWERRRELPKLHLQGDLH